MIERINKKLDIFRRDGVFISILAAILFFYRLNTYADILLVGLLSLLLLVNIKTNRFLYSYFALIFFETIMVVPLFGGTYFRLFYLLLALRVLLDFIGKRKVKMDIPTILVGAVFFVTSFIYSVSLPRNISVAMNVLSVLYISLALKAQGDYKKVIGEFLTYIAIFSALSGLFGLIRGFMFGGIDSARFYGTIDDPNYSAMFYVIGFFATIGASMIQKKWIKILLAVILVIFTLMTASITALLVLILLSYIWYTVIYGFKKSLLILLVLCIFIAGILFIPLSEGSYIGQTQNKLQKFLTLDNPTEYLNYQYPNYSELEFYLNKVTSNRYSLAKTYAIHLFYTTPVSEQWFGGNNPIEGDFINSVPVINGLVSHNSYLDMMFMMGYIFTALVLIFIGINIVRHFIRYLRTKEMEYLCIVLMMMSVLLFSMAISIFPFRYFIAFLLL